jgi:hypothetical protein
MSLSVLASDRKMSDRQSKKGKVVDILPRFRHKTSTARREAKAMRHEGEMNKRKFGSFALSVMLIALGFPAEAQQSGKVPRIGLLP